MPTTCGLALVKGMPLLKRSIARAACMSVRSNLHPHLSLALALALLASGTMVAHGQGSQPGSGTRPIQLPLSGLQPVGPSVQQSATPGGNSSVNMLNTQVNVQGAYSGSVLDPNPPAGTVSLTMAEAVRRGLAFNLGKTGADVSSQQAQAQRLSSRSALLPTVSASVSENAAKIDLAVEGFNSGLFGSSLGFAFPVTSGPFHYYDLRGSLQQNVLDFTAIHNYRSAEHSALAARFDIRRAREEIVFAVIGTYLQLMFTAALIDRQRVEVQYAEASYKQAKAQVDAGNKAPIDANRSLVELQTEQQRLRSELGDLQKQKYILARLTGLPLRIDIQTTEKLQALPLETSSVDDLIQRSFLLRRDLKSADAQLRAAEEARKAAGAEHLPSATVSGYYGMQGINPNRGNGVFQASASVNLPLFDGGRIHADVLQADAVLMQRRSELSNQRGNIELQVRNAYVDLNVANDQIQTADSNRKLALMNLQQSQDRFAIGVADSVEVVNSQEALATADHDYAGSLFSQNVAKAALAHATGQAEEDLADLFKGHN